MLKRVILYTALFVLLASLSGYTLDIPYVDVEVANSKIMEMDEENQALNDNVKKLTSENKQATATNDELIKHINTIEPILAKVDKKGQDLNDVYANIVDKPTKEKAKEAIKRNTDLKTKLRDEVKKATFEIEQNEKIIDTNKKQIEIDETKVRKNNDEISLLKSSIAKTNNQIELMKAYIDDVDSFLNEAETVLKE